MVNNNPHPIGTNRGANTKKYQYRPVIYANPHIISLYSNTIQSETKMTNRDDNTSTSSTNDHANHEWEDIDTGVGGGVSFGLIEEGEVVCAEEHAEEEEEL